MNQNVWVVCYCYAGHEGVERLVEEVFASKRGAEDYVIAQPEVSRYFYYEIKECQVNP